MKARIVKRLINVLSDGGYMVSDCMGTRSCFDVIAKREHILLIKVLTNVEAVNNRSATELKDIARIIPAVPLIIGDHIKNSKLLRGVIYARYNISAVNIETFEEILRDHFPAIYSVRGNYCVRIRPKLLSKVRERMGLTQRELASLIGISKQSIHRYESSGRVSLKMAERLMDILENDITLSMDFFPYESSADDIYERDYEGHLSMTSFKRGVIDELGDIGFLTFSTNAPFDIIAKERNHGKRILSVVGNDVKTVERKAEINKRITEITGDYSICISEKSRDLSIPIIKLTDLNRIKNTRELIQILAE